MKVHIGRPVRGMKKTYYLLCGAGRRGQWHWVLEKDLVLADCKRCLADLKRERTVSVCKHGTPTENACAECGDGGEKR